MHWQGLMGEAAVLYLCHFATLNLPLSQLLVSSVRVRHHSYTVLKYEPRNSSRISGELNE